MLMEVKSYEHDVSYIVNLPFVWPSQITRRWSVRFEKKPAKEIVHAALG
jgi:hypothetical protein